MARGPSKRQMGVALEPELRERLEVEAAKAGHSIAEEIRRRVFRTIVDDQDDRPTRGLIAAVRYLAHLMKEDTGHDWHSHPATHRAMAVAIAALLDRSKPSGAAEFAADELPAVRLVPSPDPRAIGVGLEAIAYYNRPLSDEAQRQLRERFRPIPPGEGPVSSHFAKPEGDKS